MHNNCITVVFVLLLAACADTPKAPKPPQNGAFYVGDSLNYIKYLYKDGVKMSETPFVNGKAHGLSKDYFSGGALRLTVEYRNAKRNGMTTMYYDTGEKYSEIPYADGKINGTKFNYKKDGSLTAKVAYSEGVPVPPLEEYDINGKAIAQPSIKFKTSGGILKMELSDKAFSATQFYAVEKDGLKRIPTEKKAGSLASPRKGMVIRAVYTTGRNNEGAVDAKY
ncbi:MAG: hypothetical protein LBD35_06985 [Prevotellaceae bacterium]|jgi:hypothetical protein|nr:hypothetical protein [Prevotellaceae bacterium]